MTLDTVTLDDFLPVVASVFQVKTDNLDLSLELIEAKPGKIQLPDRPRQSFSLLFRGPQTPRLLQQIIPLEHETLGLLEIFLVPVGADERGTQYEAVFN